MSVCAAICLALALSTVTPEQELQRAQTQLKAAGVGLEPAAMLEIVGRYVLRPEDQQAIEAATRQLTSGVFRERETATAALIAMGVKASLAVDARLAAAHDPESRSRLRFIAEQLTKGRDDRLLWASLIQLRKAGIGEAVQPLIQLLPELGSRRLRAAASEAIWASVSAQHAPLLQETLDSERDGARIAVALVALERLTGDSRPAWKRRDAESPVVRLAVARVLLAHQADTAARMLLELRSVAPRAEQAEAEYLLRQLFAATEQRDVPTTYRAPQWQGWVESRGERLAKLSSARHRCGALWLGISEDFSRTADASKGFGDFVHQSTVASKASVRDGRLYLEGNHPEGDQRLALLAETFVSEPSFTGPIVVEARVGGMPGNEVGWHVGLSIGKVKALFHPGFAGGAFRFEHVDTHAEYLSNQDMTFTPASGALHTMRLQVTPRPDGGALLRASVKDSGSNQVFHCEQQLTREQIGPLNRIGMERSGREGGAAIFDDFRVELN